MRLHDFHHDGQAEPKAIASTTRCIDFMERLQYMCPQLVRYTRPVVGYRYNGRVSQLKQSNLDTTAEPDGIFAKISHSPGDRKRPELGREAVRADISDVVAASLAAPKTPERCSSKR